MHKILIARHGNTFDKGDTILRVGLRTDLPLSHSGEKQALTLGKYISTTYPQLDKIYCSELIRTRQTAESICQQTLVPSEVIETLSILNEIDYGQDDGKSEQEVVQRLGQKALNDWDDHAILPSGWTLDIQYIKNELERMLATYTQQSAEQVILFVTSNGIARFLPSILLSQSELTRFKQHFKLKMPTASLSEFIYTNGQWRCQFWGKKTVS